MTFDFSQAGSFHEEDYEFDGMCWIDTKDADEDFKESIWGFWETS